MTLSMYQASVPVFLHTLAALSAVLDKAAAHATQRKIEPSVLLGTRLFPDMFPLVRQVQLAADFAKGASARLAGVEVPKYADTEATFDELKARIAKTVDFVKSLKPAQIDGSENREITIPIGGQPQSFKGQPYLPALRVAEFLLPRHRRPTTSCAIAGWRSANAISSGRSPPLERAGAGLALWRTARGFQLIIRTVLWLAGMAALLFIPAGTLNWPGAWIFLLEMCVWTFGMGAWLAGHDPELLAERLKPLNQPGQERWDKILITGAALLWAAWLAFMPLDAARYRWSHMPIWVQGLGALGLRRLRISRLPDVSREHLRCTGGERSRKSAATRS